MTQGGPLSPTIFIVVVDTVLCHRVFVVVETDGEVDSGTEGFGRDIQRLVA